jgi:BarA-like signal transduction histidine kinase
MQQDDPKYCFMQPITYIKLAVTRITEQTEFEFVSSHFSLRTVLRSGMKRHLIL